MGRGLAAILPSGRTGGESALRQIAVELIRPNPDQPRKAFDGESLLALAESIEARGILQPLVVRALPGGTYELIAGERRLRAAKIARLEEVPAIVRDAEGAYDATELESPPREPKTIAAARVAIPDVAALNAPSIAAFTSPTIRLLPSS